MNLISKARDQTVFNVKRRNLEEILNHSSQLVRSYQITNDDQRFNFVQKVLTHQASLSGAAKELGIKYSTAKTIMKVYNDEGRFEKKKHRRKKGYWRCPIVLESYLSYFQHFREQCYEKCMNAQVHETISYLPGGFWAGQIAAHSAH